MFCIFLRFFSNQIKEIRYEIQKNTFIWYVYRVGYSHTHKHISVSVGYVWPFNEQHAKAVLFLFEHIHSNHK